MACIEYLNFAAITLITSKVLLIKLAGKFWLPKVSIQAQFYFRLTHLYICDNNLIVNKVEKNFLVAQIHLQNVSANIFGASLHLNYLLRRFKGHAIKQVAGCDFLSYRAPRHLSAGPRPLISHFFHQHAPISAAHSDCVHCAQWQLAVYYLAAGEISIRKGVRAGVAAAAANKQRVLLVARYSGHGRKCKAEREIDDKESDRKRVRKGARSMLTRCVLK